MSIIKQIFENRKLTFIVLLAVTLIGTGVSAFVFINSKNINTNSLDKTELSDTELVSSGLSKAVLSVNGLSCSSCVQDIKDALSGVKGVENILVDVSGGRAQIYFDSSVIKDAQIIADGITNDAGYPATITEVLSSEDILKENAYKDQMKDLYIASVGGWDISRNDFNTELESLKSQYKTRYGENIFSTPQGLNVENNIKLQVVDQLINEGIILQDISKADYSIDDDIVQKELDEYLKNKSLTLVEVIEKSGYPEEYYLKKISKSVLINHYIEDVILSNVTSNNEKQNQYYQWFNNIKSLSPVNYYDTKLEEMIINSSSGGSGGCCG